MPPLPRGECAVCHQAVPVRVMGQARDHRAPTGRRCLGAGRPVVGVHVCTNGPACAATGCPDCERSYGPRRP
jgi:hypothetical protein